MGKIVDMANQPRPYLVCWGSTVFRMVATSEEEAIANVVVEVKKNLRARGFSDDLTGETFTARAATREDHQWEK